MRFNGVGNAAIAMLCEAKMACAIDAHDAADIDGINEPRAYQHCF